MSLFFQQILYAYEGESGEDVVASLDFWVGDQGGGGGGGGGGGALQNGNGVDRVG